MKKIVDMVITGILVLAGVALAALSCYLLSGKTSEEENFAQYQKMHDRVSVLPVAADFGDYEELHTYNKNKNDRMFTRISEAYIVRASYSAANYKARKEKFDRRYLYQDEPIVDSNGKLIPEKFTLDGFDFRFLRMELYADLNYPTRILFIGMNDDTNEIAVVYYENLKLEYIGVDFETFLKKECGWK